MRHRRRWVAGALLLALTLLAGCASFRSMQRTTQLLEANGYDGVDLSMLSSGGVDQVNLAYRGGLGDEPFERRRAERAAALVWRDLAVYFDELVFFISGTTYADGQLGYSRAGLEGLFGPRAPSLDDRRVGADVARAAARVARTAGLVAIVLLGLVTVGVLVHRRRRRRAGPAWPDDGGASPQFDPADPWAPPPG